jgi:hypothetical protein
MYTRMKLGLVAVAGAAALTLLAGDALAQKSGAAQAANRTPAAGNHEAVATSLLASSHGAFAADSVGAGVPAQDARQVNITANAETASAANPIPEPPTYGLMLVGLAAIGWLKRRRRAP